MVPSEMKPGGKLPDDFMRCIQRLVSEYQPRTVILFGSRARGDYHEESDIDLLLVKDTGEPFLKRPDRVMAILQDKPNIQVLVYTPLEIEKMLQRGNDFIETILSEGVVLYGSEPAGGNQVAFPG